MQAFMLQIEWYFSLKYNILLTLCLGFSRTWEESKAKEKKLYDGDQFNYKTTDVTIPSTNLVFHELRFSFRLLYWIIYIFFHELRFSIVQTLGRTFISHENIYAQCTDIKDIFIIKPEMLSCNFKILFIYIELFL